MNKIFVLCPPKTQTGGAELLHQLVYKLNLIEKDIAIALYYNYSTDACPTPDIYLKYTEGNYSTSFADTEDNFIILSEINTDCINTFKNAKKIVWWLSVDNFIGSIYKINKREFERINNLPFFKKIYLKFLRKFNIIKNFDPYSDTYIYNKSIKCHAHQSEYARIFLNNNKLSPNLPLSDYLNSVFILKAQENATTENCILYNPVKGFEITQQLMTFFPEYNWIALQGLSPEKMSEIMRKSKIYIDFGAHPGKDRIPREAAINHCVVITNKMGSAKNDIDVQIPTNYKFENVIEEKERFKELIDDIFENFADHHKIFEKYRITISNEEKIFDEEVQKFYEFIKDDLK